MSQGGYHVEKLDPATAVGPCASHVVVYARVNENMWEVPITCWALLILRSDGRLGLPGGKVEEGETWHGGAQRELQEEVGARIPVSEADYVSTSIPPGSTFMLHLFAVEVSKEEFLSIEAGVCRSDHYGLEIWGCVRVPLWNVPPSRPRCDGLAAFLSHHFAYNARDQLCDVLVARGVFSRAEMAAVIKEAQVERIEGCDATDLEHLRRRYEEDDDSESSETALRSSGENGDDRQGN